jgi:hypothetical protein
MWGSTIIIFFNFTFDDLIQFGDMFLGWSNNHKTKAQKGGARTKHGS